MPSTRTEIARPGAPADARLRPGSPDASSAIWRWRDHRDAPASASREAGRLRGHGLRQALIGLAIAAVVRFLFHRVTLAWIIAAIAASTLAIALVSPLGAYQKLRTGLDRFGIAVGKLLAWILLPFVYYVVVLPYGLLARRGRRDRMARWYEPKAGSYWKPRPDTHSASYERQF